VDRPCAMGSLTSTFLVGGSRSVCVCVFTRPRWNAVCLAENARTEQREGVSHAGRGGTGPRAGAHRGRSFSARRITLALASATQPWPPLESAERAARPRRFRPSRTALRSKSPAPVVQGGPPCPRSAAPLPERFEGGPGPPRGVPPSTPAVRVQGTKSILPRRSRAFLRRRGRF